MKIFFIFCQIVLLIGREFRQPTGVHDGRRGKPGLGDYQFFRMAPPPDQPYGSLSASFFIS
jgi:hypothetical protein